jgi:hypothetical protein
METIISNRALHPAFLEIFETEDHYRHNVVKITLGSSTHSYWQTNTSIYHFLQPLGLHQLSETLLAWGLDRNTELYRKLYRDMGCSLFNYKEIFYMPNDAYHPSQYIPNAKKTALPDKNIGLQQNSIELIDSTYVQLAGLSNSIQDMATCLNTAGYSIFTICPHCRMNDYKHTDLCINK